MEDSFHCSRNAMSPPSVLALSDSKMAFVVKTAGSAVAIGVVLAKDMDEEKIHPIQFVIRTMTAAD